MKINPATKTAACKALGTFAEKAVAMADVINKAEEDGSAPALLPAEMASSVTAMASELAKEMGPLMPQASADPAAAAAPPEVEMTTEMSAEVEKSIAKMGGLADVIEKGLQKSLTAANVAKVAKGLDDVASFRKALGDVPVAKAGAPKKLSFSQYMKMQGTLLERFMALVMEFLPLLASSGDVEAAPASDASPMGDVDMAKAVELAVAKSTEVVLSRVESMLAERVDGRFGAVTEQLTAIAKSRDAGHALPAGPKPAKDDDDEPVIPFTSLTERMRAKGQLPKAQ